MKYTLSDFDYRLPKELIARYPIEPRDSCRLMVLDRKKGSIEHKTFRDIVQYLQEGDTLVLNDTKVIPARLKGRKETGAKVEVFLLRQVDKDLWEALVKNLKRLKEGQEVIFGKGFKGELVEKRENGTALIRLKGNDIQALIEKYGQVPLPPYIERESEEKDREEYQTVFARKEGAVASPTAGLHFTRRLLEEIREKGVNVEFITLHVGLGTFKPVSEEDFTKHRIHEEYYHIPEKTVRAIQQTKEKGKRVFAVGTTVVRTLETYAITGEREGFSSLFIYPPFRFQVVDSLITNFHLPKSTLLLLVSAFASRDMILEAYRTAVRERYRFFSYGDAMLII
ncbi:MAG: tRNA preQ1(34) S-adenosylmethionine ribosyltransferase-isomerase QueA [Aquificae bacterium]|nr:tRNA preQ1(34) S-adenosylmethionine ribosyltransferase-isomerase QueA [Aquificota bacterium]